MSHLETPALPQLQVPWVRLSISQALRFTPHLVLGTLCPPWSHPHPPHPHQRCPLRPQSNTDCGFLLFSFSPGETSSLSSPPYPVLCQLLTPWSHLSLQPLYPALQPKCSSVISTCSWTGLVVEAEVGEVIVRPYLYLGCTSLMSSGMDRKGEGTDEKMSPWALAV